MAKSEVKAVNKATKYENKTVGTLSDVLYHLQKDFPDAFAAKNTPKSIPPPPQPSPPAMKRRLDNEEVKTGTRPTKRAVLISPVASSSVFSLPPPGDASGPLTSLISLATRDAADAHNVEEPSGNVVHEPGANELAREAPNEAPADPQC